MSSLAVLCQTPEASEISGLPVKGKSSYPILFYEQIKNFFIKFIFPKFLLVRVTLSQDSESQPFPTLKTGTRLPTSSINPSSKLHLWHLQDREEKSLLPRSWTSYLPFYPEDASSYSNTHAIKLFRPAITGISPPQLPPLELQPGGVRSSTLP